MTMAARLNNRHQDMVRQKIQAAKLINLLQEEAFGQRTLSDGSRDSAKFLLNKTLSNAPNVVHGAGDEGQHKIEVTLTFK